MVTAALSCVLRWPGEAPPAWPGALAAGHAAGDGGGPDGGAAPPP